MQQRLTIYRDGDSSQKEVYKFDIMNYNIKDYTINKTDLVEIRIGKWKFNVYRLDDIFDKPCKRRWVTEVRNKYFEGDWTFLDMPNMGLSRRIENEINKIKKFIFCYMEGFKN